MNPPQSGDCATPPAAPELVGWATEAGGTTGGGGATPTIVTTIGELEAAVEGTEAGVVHVDGRGGQFATNGRLQVGSNKTIVGICGAEIMGSIRIEDASNVIMRNLRVVGFNCSDSPGDCRNGDDAISVVNSNHLWFDHLEVLDGSDGNLDLTVATDYVTISWTKFLYSTMRTDPIIGASGHRWSNLIGGADDDVGEYRITFHHNWWADFVDARMPRTRFGDIHVFNNLYTSAGNDYCTNAGIDTQLLVQNNVYIGVNDPFNLVDNGDMLGEGNLFQGTTGSTDDGGGGGFVPPYAFQPDAAESVESLVRAEAGPR